MTARTMPSLPSFAYQSVPTSAQLGQLIAWQEFWANPPMFRMYQTIAQPLATGTDTQLTMDTPDYDTDSGRSLTTPWAYTIPFAGRWEFKINFSAGANATGGRQGKVFKNGVVVTGGEAGAQAAATPANSNGFISVTFLCALGDVIAPYGWQASGGSLNTNVGTNCSTFEGRLVSLNNP